MGGGHLQTTWTLHAPTHPLGLYDAVFKMVYSSLSAPELLMMPLVREGLPMGSSCGATGPARGADRCYAVPRLRSWLAVQAFLVAGALSLFTFNNALKFIGTAASKSFASGGGIQKTIQPYAAAIKPVVDNIFGGAAFQVKLEHILLAAIVIVLIGIWRSIHINGQHLAEIAGAKKEEAKTKKGAAAAAAAAAPAPAASN